ncbi:hypothetical protein HDU87_003156 [Geranomyces variabilis]|uniref:O-methyltransferase domain-containing protein n=1 Tax=Geranomyces variabilis TaxID=109894 RepID=A0AAD5TKG4_9FUNG|nr:hypothetical protein HDU87_003156 [Geranomyces variabilis]
MSSPHPAMTFLGNDTLVYDHLMANRRTALLMVAVKLKLFTRIADSVPATMTAKQLATEHGLSLRGADAMLVGLCSMGLLHRLPAAEAGQSSSSLSTDFTYSESYRLSLQAERQLVTHKSTYLGHLINMDSIGYLTPDNLLKSLQADKPQVHGENTDPWEKQEQSKELNTMFTLGMRSISIVAATALRQQAETFAHQKVVLDVGAGPGVHIAEVLKEWPAMRAIYFELPQVCKINRPYLQEQGVLDRIEMVEGSMFTDPYPTHHKASGAAVDTVLLSQILHDWPIHVGCTLLQKAFTALQSGGLLVIHEKLLANDRSGPVSTAMVSIDMLFWTEGQQFTAEQLHAMLHAAGFEQPKTIPTVEYWSITVARKPLTS